jgi:hypothetical protein
MIFFHSFRVFVGLYDAYDAGDLGDCGVEVDENVDADNEPDTELVGLSGRSC